MQLEVKGRVILIDDEDFERVSEKRWHFCRGYARTRDGYKHVYLHQFILGKMEGMQIDHINRNILDNRKSNLRFVTKAQNSYNRNKREGAQSKYIGVCKSVNGPKRRKSWRALIKSKLIGYYETEREAALAYDIEALKAYGEYAPLNLLKFKDD